MPALGEAREVIGAFQTMIRAMAPDKLERWITRAIASLVAAFARGILEDQSAVRAAITLPWSNGQAEGQMYGRGKIGLLQSRLTGLPP